MKLKKGLRGEGVGHLGEEDVNETTQLKKWMFKEENVEQVAAGVAGEINKITKRWSKEEVVVELMGEDPVGVKHNAGEEGSKEGHQKGKVKEEE